MYSSVYCNIFTHTHIYRAGNDHSLSIPPYIAIYTHTHTYRAGVCGVGVRYVNRPQVAQCDNGSMSGHQRGALPSHGAS